MYLQSFGIEPYLIICFGPHFLFLLLALKECLTVAQSLLWYEVLNEKVEGVDLG